MVAGNLINESITPLKCSDSVETALEKMSYAKFEELPVIEDEKLIGVVKEDDLFSYLGNSSPICDLDLDIAPYFVSEYQHFYEALRLADEHQCRIIPVLDSQNRYLGATTVSDVAFGLAEKLFVQSEGAIIVLSIPAINYSLSHISRLVEENDAKILSCFTESDDADSAQLIVTIKLNTKSLNHIVATLDRFEYKTIAHFGADPTSDINKDRLGYFFRMFDL